MSALPPSALNASAASPPTLFLRRPPRSDPCHAVLHAAHRDVLLSAGALRQLLRLLRQLPALVDLALVHEAVWAVTKLAEGQMDTPLTLPPGADSAAGPGEGQAGGGGADGGSGAAPVTVAELLEVLVPLLHVFLAQGGGGGGDTAHLAAAVIRWGWGKAGSAGVMSGPVAHGRRRSCRGAARGSCAFVCLFFYWTSRPFAPCPFLRQQGRPAAPPCDTYRAPPRNNYLWF